MGDNFPADVKEFIGQNIHTLAQLEVLLMLRAEPERSWTVNEITNVLYLERQMVNDLLMDLVRRGFAVRLEASFRYQPVNEAVGRLIDRLAQLYHERRVAVTTEIFSKPIDIVKAFANAFRLREEK
jgi:DNA-binding MarR family transcriptional regulator